MIESLCILIAVLGVAAYRWGTTRLVVLDQRGWQSVYRIARVSGLPLALVGVVVAIGVCAK